MKTRSVVAPEMFAGNFIQEAESRLRNGRIDRQVELQCNICEAHFIASLNNAKRAQQQTCSNQCAGVLRQKMEGGNMRHPLYSRWLSMRDRCNNPNNVRYVRYGARGIHYDPLFDDFKEYAKYCESLLSDTHLNNLTPLQIDRINNNIGYFKGNLRWANIATQSANKSLIKTPTSTSEYVGVCYCKTNKRWIAKVQFQNIVVHQSSHLTEFDALYARQEYIIDHDLPHQLK